MHPVTRRRWPNGRVTHDELRPLKVLASRMPCPYLNPGPYVGGRPLVQGMRVALAAEVERTHEELVERILHAGLAYSDTVDRETSLVVCNDPAAEHGKGYLARQLGVPVISDAQFWTAFAPSSAAPAWTSSPTPRPIRSWRCSDQARAARLTADTTARNEAVVMDGAMPTPHTVRPLTDASTYAAACASSPELMACSE